MEDKLKIWGEELAEVHLPRWDELPDLDLYMDQVLHLVDNYFKKFISKDKPPLLTKAMVNNYVKLQLIPAPEKKRYSRRHLAFLIAITLLKQVLTIPEIRAGILFQGQHDGIRNAYNIFCEEQEKALQIVALQAQGKASEGIFSEVNSPYYLAVKSAAFAFAAKLLAEEAIRLEDERMKVEENSDEQT
ncbi:DUF1836 domain-containing protein [Enterococcus sp. LJL120]